MSFETAPLRDLSPDELGLVAKLSHISETLNASYDVEDVLKHVIDVVLEALGAQRGFVMLDRGGEEPEVAVARGFKSEVGGASLPVPSGGFPRSTVPDGTQGPEEIDADQFNYSRSLVAQVLAEGEPVLSHDVMADERLSAKRSLQLIGTRSIMCVPMRTRSRSLGLIYLDNQLTFGAFTESDLDLLKIIADLAAAAIERASYFSHLVQSEKMAALGTLVAGIAHELNNPLTSIMGLAQLLREDLPEGSENAEMAVRMHKETVRCRNLVRELLSLSRREAAPRRPTQIRELIESAGRLASTQYRQSDVTLDVQVGDCPTIDLNADQWTQVLLNLLTNALQACRGRDGARVHLKAGCQDGHLRITVIDNGPGIPPQHLRQIFDPFFTTKPVGEGTGLGLSITHSIVTEHGGVITAHNDRQGGAVFTIELPIPGVAQAT